MRENFRKKTSSFLFYSAKLDFHLDLWNSSFFLAIENTSLTPPVKTTTTTTANKRHRLFYSWILRFFSLKKNFYSIYLEKKEKWKLFFVCLKTLRFFLSDIFVSGTPLRIILKTKWKRRQRKHHHYYVIFFEWLYL